MTNRPGKCAREGRREMSNMQIMFKFQLTMPKFMVIALLCSLSALNFGVVRKVHTPTAICQAAVSSKWWDEKMEVDERMCKWW